LHKIHFKEACIISISWILAALIFNIILWYYLKTKFNYTLANQKALEFFTGYLIEKSLSLDNIFVFVLIFKYFDVPKNYQRLVLTYGIVTAILLRLIMILSGVWVIEKIHWILRVFGVFLIISGSKILTPLFYNKPKTYLKQLKDPDARQSKFSNFIINLCHKYLKTTKTVHQKNLFIIQHGKLRATPLFLAMILIEISDIIFATDSIPAIFAILDDPLIIITSNIFAILGLRSLYFFLATGLKRFCFLTPGVAIILIFIGIKMVFSFEISIITTLATISSILVGSILLSLNKS